MTDVRTVRDFGVCGLRRFQDRCAVTDVRTLTGSWILLWQWFQDRCAVTDVRTRGVGPR